MSVPAIAAIAPSASATASALASIGASVASSATTGAGTLSSLVESAVPHVVASVLPSGVTTTVPVTATTVTIPSYLEISAAFAGALAGALTGVERKFDAVGVTSLAIVAGLGGGIIRDLLLQKYGIYALENPRLLITTLIAAVLGFFFFSAASRVKPLLFMIDALSLGLFCVTGSDKALLAGLSVIPAILVGTITSVGGGVVRDLLTDEVPQVMRPGGFYATASAVGAILYVTMVTWLDIVKPIAMLIVVVVVLALRVLSEHFGWVSPSPVDLSDTVAKAPGRAIGGISQFLGRNAERTAGRASAAEAEAAENEDVEPGVSTEPAEQPTTQDEPPATRAP